MAGKVLVTYTTRTGSTKGVTEITTVRSLDDRFYLAVDNKNYLEALLRCLLAEY